MVVAISSTLGIQFLRFSVVSSQTKKEKKQNEIESEALQKIRHTKKQIEWFGLKSKYYIKNSTAHSVQIRATERGANVYGSYLCVF